MKIQFKIQTPGNRIWEAPDGKVWQLMKSEGWGGWNLYEFNTMEDYLNVWDIDYEAWVDGGFNISSAKDWIQRYYKKEVI